LTAVFRNIDQNIGEYYLQDLLLNIALGESDIFFSISSIKTEKNLALVHYTFENAFESSNSSNASKGNDISVDKILDNLSQLRAKEKILSSALSYKNVNYTILDYKATIIPKKYFNEKEQEKYISLLFANSNNLTYFSEKISQIKAVAVSGINPAYTTALSIPYPTAKYRSVYSILVQKIFAISEEKTYKRFDTHVLLNINDKTFELVVKKSNKLIFINTFPYLRKSDILYYFLYALNKLGLDMGAIAVLLCGKAQDLDLMQDIKTQAYHTYCSDNHKFLLVL
jgi:hypothetical protein